MDINEAISGRRSTREYTTQAVDEETIHRLIEVAVLAPNAVNEQPCTFTVVRDQDLLDRISREAKSHMLATMPAGAQSAHFHSMLGNEDFQIFYHAPVLILISGNAQGPWIVEDCALAAENLMLAAYASGLGTCWIGWIKPRVVARIVPESPRICSSVRPCTNSIQMPARPAPPSPRQACSCRWRG